MATVLVPLRYDPQGASEVQAVAAKARTGADESHFSWLDESQTQQTFANAPDLEADQTTNGAEAHIEIHQILFGDRLEHGKRTGTHTVSITDHERDRLSTLDSSPVALPTQTDVAPASQAPATSLLERTRQSMSVAAAAAERKAQRKNTTGSRLSRCPVSQFETPDRAGYGEPPQSATSNDSISGEHLFIDDADYTSVFRTRPKVALSPVISPERALLVDNILEQQMEELDMEDDKT